MSYQYDVLNFPSSRAMAVRIIQANDDPGCWLVLTRNRDGWVHGDFHGALADAREIAAGHRVAVISSAGVLSCK
jgi:hypothetical protein